MNCLSLNLNFLADSILSASNCKATWSLSFSLSLSFSNFEEFH